MIDFICWKSRFNTKNRPMTKKKHEGPRRNPLLVGIPRPDSERPNCCHSTRKCS